MKITPQPSSGQSHHPTATTPQFLDGADYTDQEFYSELRKLSDLAAAFLSATDGDNAKAEALLDDFIELIFEGGVLSTWRYRVLLAGIREGFERAR